MFSRRFVSSSFFAAKNTALAIACSVAGLMVLSMPAQAQTFAGWTGSGTSGTDPYSQTWVHTPGIWGIPGPGNGVIPWAGPDLLTNFAISFTNLPGGVSIQDPSFLSTRMRNTTAGVDWLAGLITPSGETVLFFAPPGGELNPGDSFFVNVTFTDDQQNSAFTALYNMPIGVVPEPGTFALLGLGVLPLVGMIARRRKS